MLLKEIYSLQEAKPVRAWNGKLKNIDELLRWMYNADILTKGEKNNKDKIFNQYYRYYNDGDMPAALKTKGFSKYSDPKKVEAALEEYLETFVKSILSKYMAKIDRSEFRVDVTLENLSTVLTVAERYDAEALVNYWLKKVKIEDNDSTLKKLVDTLSQQVTELKAEAAAADPATKGKILFYVRKEFADTIWTKSMETKWRKITETIDEIIVFIENLCTSLRDIKKQKLIK